MQRKLFPSFKSDHGGELSRDHRKRLRPLCAKRPLHLVIKSRRNLYRRRDSILPIVRKQAEKFSIRIYGSAVAADHIHLVFKFPSRQEYVKFIRALTGLLARKLGAKLWRLPPFSRVVFWGSDFVRVLKYLAMNRAEASGEVAYTPRKRRALPK